MSFRFFRPFHFLFGILGVALFCFGAFGFSGVERGATSGGALVASSSLPSGSSVKEIIAHARELVLDEDRARACGFLVHAMAKQTKSSAAYRELASALDELSEIFLTEQGQSSWALGESLLDAKPREAIEPLQAALKSEKDNVAVLKDLARAHLSLLECELGDASTKQAELVVPSSPEIRLLRLQAADCSRNSELFETLLAERDVDMEPMSRYVKALQAKEIYRKKEIKRVKPLLAAWEHDAPDDPELDFWRWQFSASTERPDRPAAARYSQACQNLSPRKRKAFRLDIDLCKGKDVVDAYLKSAGLLPSSPTGGVPNG